MSFKNKINRRNFLGQAGCAAMGTATFMNTLVNLMTTNAMAGSSLQPNEEDYKALVCVLLAGGNDSYNMLVPLGDDEYAEYSTTRGGTNRGQGGIALTQSSILPLRSGTNNGKTFGVHPSMGGVQSLYDSRDLAFISNVGTLIRPITNKAQYDADKTLRPLGLFSHSDQIEQWQTSIPNSREAFGWGGKMADMLQDLNGDQAISMNISLSGKNVFQSGREVIEYSINTSNLGGTGFREFPTGWGENGLMTDLKNNTVDSLMADIYGNVFKETMGTLTRQTIDTQEKFATAIGNANTFETTTFQTDRLSQSLRQIARVISVNPTLNVKRQVFFVTLGGWDHHNEVINEQNVMLGWVSNAIKSFMDALESINMKDQVTLFTISDFARTLSSNGRGSDHAWGGNSIVAGGSVVGRKIYGTYPDLYLTDNPLMTDNRGRMIPTTSVDEIFAELAIWFGVPKCRLGELFPNLSEFYNINRVANPIGFLPTGVPAIEC